MKEQAVISGINGPVIKASGASNLQMLEMVQVGNSKLIGEVIGISEKYCTIQVYEETSGLKIGEPVYSTGSPLSLVLGPGIIGEVFDGIQRPLETLKAEFGNCHIILIDQGSHITAWISSRANSPHACWPR